MDEPEKTKTQNQDSIDAPRDAKSDNHSAQTNGNTESEKHSNSEKSKDGSKDKKKEAQKPSDKKDDKQPAGGYDPTPLPEVPGGWTIKITIHKAENLPPADLSSMSSDPYVVTQMYCQRTMRHKEDPALKWRTFTQHRTTDPEWNEEWILANVPSSGFKLKCRLYDEDTNDHDDRLGNAHIEVDHIDENWKGFHEKIFKIKKHMGSKRAYLVQAFATCVRIRDEMSGHLVVSIQLLGRTESQYGGRVYTVGPQRWMKHYSPLLGRMTGKKTPLDASGILPSSSTSDNDNQKKSKTERYNFQANQMQLCGPVPKELYHRYVEFKGFVKGMFTGVGLRGFILHKALSHQHHQIYRFDTKTEFGYLDEKPSKESALKFLELVDYDKGGRIFTYVITLDGMFRFTETGKEFGIDMLSKHTMHSDVSIYIAISGEFLVRSRQTDHSHSSESDSKSVNPENYELIIDNNSGTYRPKGELLPKLQEFLEFNFPGLHIMTLDCNKDADEEKKLKQEQREKKTQERGDFVFRQTSRSSSFSSSDEDDLEEMEAAGEYEPGTIEMVTNAMSKRGSQKRQKIKSNMKPPKRETLTEKKQGGTEPTGSGS